MFNKKEKIKEINQKLNQVNDMRDEYKYWDEDTTTKNFGILLTGFEGLLKGVKELLKHVK